MGGNQVALKRPKPTGAFSKRIENDSDYIGDMQAESNAPKKVGTMDAFVNISPTYCCKIDTC